MTPSFGHKFKCALLRILPLVLCAFTPTGLSPSKTQLSSCLGFSRERLERVHNSTSPVTFITGFGLPCTGFTRRYFRHRNCFLFLPVVRCFRSRGSHSLMRATGVAPRQEVPFSNPRFKGCLHLAWAFRRLPRPSWALEPSHSPGGFLSSYYSC